MIVRISCEQASKKYNFKPIKDFISLVDKLPLGLSQIHIQIEKMDFEQPVLEYYDIDSRLNGQFYIHYAYVSIQTTEPTRTFQAVSLLKNYCEILGFDIELFYKP